MPIYFKRAIISTKGVVQLNLWVVVLLKFSVQDNITGTPDKKFVGFFLIKLVKTMHLSFYFYLVILLFLHIFDIYIVIFTDR